MLKLLLVMSLVVVLTEAMNEGWMPGNDDDDDVDIDDDVDVGELEENMFDEEEIQAVLKKYDIDDDGVLSQEEMELGRAEIEAIVKRKIRDLQKQQKKTHPGTADESEKQKHGAKGVETGSNTNYMMMTLVAGGFVLVVFLVIMKRKQPTAPMVTPETEEMMMRNREKWLENLSSQSKANQENKSQNRSKQSMNQSRTSEQNTLEQLRTGIDSRVAKNDSYSLPREESLEMSKDSNLGELEDVSFQTHERYAKADGSDEGRECLKSCDTKGDSKNKDPNHKSNGGSVQIDPVHHEQPVVAVKSGDTVTAAPTTLDKDNFTQFLSHVLDCSIEVSASVRTRYNLRSLVLETRDVPTTPEAVPMCLSKIMLRILPRQISRVKYCIRCYSNCEKFAAGFNDKLVSAASDWFEGYCLDVIRMSLITTMTASSQSEEEDLWSDYNSEHSASEAMNFLWHLAGWGQDNISVSENLLSRLLQNSESVSAAAKGGNSAVTFLTLLLRAAGQQLSSVKRMDEVILTEGRTLRSLEILLGNPEAGSVMANALEVEVLDAANDLGNYFENTSLLGPLLSVSTVPTKLLVKGQLVLTGNATLPFTSLRGFPQITEADLRQIESAIQEGIHRCQNVVFVALRKVITSKASRERGLTWIASVISLNELRTSALIQNISQVQACCTDAYMLNFCAMLLKFVLPFCGDFDKLNKVDLAYSTSDACRLNYDFETCLAGGQIVNDNNLEQRIGPLPTELQTKHNFITESFHLCQRALSVGIIPTVVHYNKMQRDFMLNIQAVQGSPQEERMKNQRVLLSLMWDTCLCDEELVRDTTMFYLSQAQLLITLLKTSGQGAASEEERVKAERKAFSKIPEFCVKDMAVWFRFVAAHAIHIHKDVWRGLSVATFVDSCVSLLERPDLMPGPIPASKIVSCLLQFLNSSTTRDSRGWGSGVMSDLAVMVETCPSVQKKLGPALLHTYISVDVVEGLDVDKDEFDKYTARSEIGKLIEHLWRRTDCRSSIVEQCQADLFQNFLGAILDTLLYMLHDGLSRLANIKKFEVARQNESEWNALSMKEKNDKEQFLKNEEFVGKGFIAMADQTLEFIDLLTKAEEVAQVFTRQPLSRRSASVICGFLDVLCGSRAKDFKVKDFGKYNFSPQKLLLHISTILLRIAREVEPSSDSFLVCVATDVDFTVSNLEKAHTVIHSKGLAQDDTLVQLEDLTAQLGKMQKERQSDMKQDVSTAAHVLQELETVTVDKDRVVEVYTGCMAASRLTTTEIQDSHSFQSNLQALDSRCPKVKALIKEMKHLQQNLPIHPDAAICVVQDEERIDVMRAMVTGPVDTPYSLGCFVFDIYFPASYPNSPPLVKILTTGGGTVRFNPNLYPDGKVCLSLLGTWHGGDASEKWNPRTSTIYQVLVSIQSLILIPDPMFNEPGYDRLEGTAEGRNQSREYSLRIQLNTLRHAILGQLRHPPAGLERIIRRHFALQKECVFIQCREWLAECHDEDQAKRMQQLISAIYTELKDLEVPGKDDDDDDC